MVDHSLYATVKGSGYGAGRISLERNENGSMNYYLAVFVIGAVVALVVFSVI